MDASLYDIIAGGASLGLTALSVVFGLKGKRYLDTLKEVAKSLDDGRITKEEVRNIIKAWTKGKV